MPALLYKPRFSVFFPPSLLGMKTSIVASENRRKRVTL
jgi:hypothetical protein